MPLRLFVVFFVVSLFFKKMDSCEDEESIAPEVASILLLLFLFFWLEMKQNCNLIQVVKLCNHRVYR